MTTRHLLVFALGMLLLPLACVKETEPETECSDERDNDLDGLWDCDDPDCSGVDGCAGDDDTTADDDTADDDSAGDDDTVDDDDSAGDDDDSAGDDDDSAGDDDDSAGDDDDSAGDDDDSAGDDDDTAGDDDDTTLGGPPPSDFALVDGNSTSATFGQTFSLADHLGEAVVMYFGYATCGICQYCSSALQAVYDGHPGWAGSVQMWFMNPVGYDPDEMDLVDSWHLPVLQDTVDDSAWTSWNALQGETYIVHPDGTLYWYDDYLTCPGDSASLSSQLELLVGP